MSLLELVTLGLADSKSPWSFFLHGSKLHDPRLLLHIVAFKGFGMSEWVDLVIASGRCEPVSQATCDEINSLVGQLDISDGDKDYMRHISIQPLRQHCEHTVYKELKWKQPRKRDKRGRFKEQFKASLFSVMWSRVKYHVLVSLLLRSLRLQPPCKRTIARIETDFYYDWDRCSAIEIEPDSADPEFLCIWNDIIQEWAHQYVRLCQYYKRNRKVK